MNDKEIKSKLKDILPSDLLSINNECLRILDNQEINHKNMLLDKHNLIDYTLEYDEIFDDLELIQMNCYLILFDLLRVVEHIKLF